MGVGVFGKLPARRDYVQHQVERQLMAVLDPWLQKAVASSRKSLGEAWLDHYLQAPIWHFWLGPRIAGATVLGALMPSVDGVGRYFPLCALGRFPDAPPPPEADLHEDWFARLETLMLATLSDEGTYEALVEGLDGMPPPGIATETPDPAVTVNEMFAALREANVGDFYAEMSCWWIGGAANVPQARLWKGLPPPEAYAEMIAVPELSARLSLEGA